MTTLSAEQKRAIQGKAKHKLVVAGAGTGKTTLLEHNIKHLIANGQNTESILMLTFSKTAARNIKNRLRKKYDISNVQCSTIHAFGLKIIMTYWKELGFTKKPKVKIRSLKQQQDEIVKKAIKGIASKEDKKAIKKAVKLGFKNPNAPRTAADSAATEKRIKDAIATNHHILAKRKEQNWVTYNDMIDLPLQLFRERPESLRQVSQQVRHLMVDEAQDISMKEAHLIYLLANNASSSMIVGDPKQCIYGFRNASSACMTKLRDKLDAEVYYLTETFRLPKPSLALVNAVAKDINDDPKIKTQFVWVQASLPEGRKLRPTS